MKAIFILSIIGSIVLIVIIVSIFVMVGLQTRSVSQIDDHFWIGGKSAIKLKKNWNRILAVDNDLSYKRIKYVKPDQKILHLRTCDRGKGFNQENLQRAMDFIDEGYENDEKILIHCKKGKNRSVSLLVAYLILKFGMSWKEAFEQVQKKRVDAKVWKQNKQKIEALLPNIKIKSNSKYFFFISPFFM